MSALEWNVIFVAAQTVGGMVCGAKSKRKLMAARSGFQALEECVRVCVADEPNLLAQNAGNAFGVFFIGNIFDIFAFQYIFSRRPRPLGWHGKFMAEVCHLQFAVTR